MTPLCRICEERFSTFPAPELRAVGLCRECYENPPRRSRGPLIGRLLCRLGFHRSDYSGNPHTHAPAPIRCERCRKELR